MKNMTSNLKAFLRRHWPIVAMYAVLSLLYASMALYRHIRYLTIEDLAIYDQIFWYLSRFEWPWSSFHWLNRPFFSDHLQPMYFLIVPAYWVYSGPETLLFIQPFITLLAIFPLFFLTERLLNNRRAAYLLVLAFSFYIPLQNMLLYDFHEMAFVPPLILSAYYFFRTKKRSLFNISLLLLLFVKENMGFLVATVGLWLLLQTSWWRLGIMWLILGMLYTLIAIHFVMPAVGGNFIYLDFGQSGSSPLDILRGAATDPLRYANFFIDDPIKRHTLLHTFLPYLFLPLVSPFTVLLSLEQFAERFWYLSRYTHWTMRFHYSAPIAAIVAVGAISALEKVRKLTSSAAIVTALAGSFLVITLYQSYTASPIRMFFDDQTWEKTDTTKRYDEALALIPVAASVQTHNFITPHVSGRKRFDYFKASWDADYILVNLALDEPKYILTGFDDGSYWQGAVYDLIGSGRYVPVYRHSSDEHDVILLKKTDLSRDIAPFHQTR